MDIIIKPLYHVIDLLLGLYIWVIIITVVLNWLISFGVINYHNNFVSMIGEFLFKLTEPVLAPLRRWLPSLGRVDISPFVLILGIYFVHEVLYRIVMRILAVGA